MLLTIGERLMDLREERMWTQGELSEHAGVSPATINKIENGHIERPRFSTIRKLARALEVEPVELWAGQDVEASQAAETPLPGRMPMRVAYVAGPYRADTIAGTVENIRAAEAVAKELWKLGMAAIVPHLNTALFDGICPDEVWLAGDLEILSRCDLLVLVPDWRDSSGAVDEMYRALELDIPVYEWLADSERLWELV